MNIRYKTAGALALILSLTLLVASCQKTPEGPVVVNKGNDSLEEQIAASPAPRQAFEAESVWQYEETRDSTTLKIAADVFIPDVDAFPVLKITQETLDIETVDAIKNAFFPDQELYDFAGHTADEMGVILVQTRALQAKYSPSDTTYGIIYPNAEADWLESIQNAKNAMGSPIPITLTTEGDYASFYGRTKQADGVWYSISMYDQVSGTMSGLIYSKSVSQGSIIEAPYTWDASIEMLLSYDLAQSIAEETLNQLGLSQMQLAHTTVGMRCTEAEQRFFPMLMFSKKKFEEAEKAYIFFYTPSYEGIPCNFSYSDPSKQEELPSQYAQIWEEEFVRIVVGKYGVESITWENGNGVVDEILNENVQLLPFSDIQERAIQQLFTQYTLTKNEGVHKTIEINAVHLSYRKVLIRNTQDAYMLIPAWDFFWKSYL